jgi:hypothetical protein
MILSFYSQVGWKFTALAGQKAAELSENVTEKVRDKRLYLDDRSAGSVLAVTIHGLLVYYHL